MSNYKVGAIFTAWEDTPVDRECQHWAPIVDLERVMEGAPYPQARGSWTEAYAAIGKFMHRVVMGGDHIKSITLSREDIEPKDEARLKVKLVMEE